MRSLICAAAIAVMVPESVGAQAPALSATTARDIGGYALGMSIADVRKRMTLAHVASETFSGIDGDISYEFGFTPSGRVFRIQSVQKLGRFVPDGKFVQTITGKLTEKYGAPKSNQFPDGPMSWDLIETVPRASGQSLPSRTMWMDAMLSDADGEATLVLNMLDFRILWADQSARNQLPRQQAEDRVRF